MDWFAPRPWVAAVGFLGIMVVLLAFCGRRDKTPVIDIVSPQAEVNAIQRERDGKVANSFNSIDAQRERDDAKIKETTNRPKRKGNVNAQQLENMLR